MSMTGGPFAPMEPTIEPEVPEEGRSWKDKMLQALMLGTIVMPGAAIGKAFATPLRRGLTAGAVGAGAGVLAAPDAAAEPPAAPQGPFQAAAPDPMTQLMELQQRRAKIGVDIATQLNGDPARKIKAGKGPNFSLLQQEAASLDKQIEGLTTLLGQQGELKASEQTKQQADERNQTRLYSALGGGVAGAGLSGLAAMLTKGRANKFGTVASELAARMKGAPTGNMAGTQLGDDVAGLVDEAYTLRNQPAPFGPMAGTAVDESSLASKVRGLDEGFNQTLSPEAIAAQSYKQAADGASPPSGAGWFRGNRAALREADMVGKEVASARSPFVATQAGKGLGDNFEKPMDFGLAEFALPGAGLADAGIMHGLAAMSDNPSDKHQYEMMGDAGLGFAAGSKLGRLLTKPITPLVANKAAGGNAGLVAGARNRLQRDMGAYRKPSGKRYAETDPTLPRGTPDPKGMPPPAPGAAPQLGSPPPASGPTKVAPPHKQTYKQKTKLLADGRIAAAAHTQKLRSPEMIEAMERAQIHGLDPRRALADVRKKFPDSYIPKGIFEREYRKAGAEIGKFKQGLVRKNVAERILGQGGNGYDFANLARAPRHPGYQRDIRSAIEDVRGNVMGAERMSNEEIAKMIRGIVLELRKGQKGS